MSTVFSILAFYDFRSDGWKQDFVDLSPYSGDLIDEEPTVEGVQVALQPSKSKVGKDEPFIIAIYFTSAMDLYAAQDILAQPLK